MRFESPLKSRTWSSIRTQIILGFALILGLTLVIVVINFFTLQIIRSGIEATVDEAGRVRELSQAIQNEFLQARQQEQLFLENWRSLGYDEAFKQHVVENDQEAKEISGGPLHLQEGTSPQRKGMRQTDGRLPGVRVGCGIL